jgi:hypothetical protein
MNLPEETTIKPTIHELTRNDTNTAISNEKSQIQLRSATEVVLCALPRSGRDVCSLVILRTARSIGAQCCFTANDWRPGTFRSDGARLFKVAGCYKHFAPPEQERFSKLRFQIEFANERWKMSRSDAVKRAPVASHVFAVS